MCMPRKWLSSRQAGVKWQIRCKTCKSRDCCSQNPLGHLTHQELLRLSAPTTFNRWQITHPDTCNCHSSRSWSRSSFRSRWTVRISGSGNPKSPVLVSLKHLRLCLSSLQSISLLKTDLPAVNSLLRDRARHPSLRTWHLSRNLRQANQLKHCHDLGQRQQQRRQGPQMSSKRL